MKSPPPNPCHSILVDILFSSFVCVLLHVHVCTRACGDLRLMLVVISDCSSTLFSETESLSQTQSTQYDGAH